MIEVMMLAFFFAFILGWLEGGRKLKEVRKHPKLGVKPSKDCGTYIFVDIQ